MVPYTSHQKHYYVMRVVVPSKSLETKGMYTWRYNVLYFMYINPLG